MFVIVYVGLLLVVPSTQVIGPLGGAGVPAVLFGVLLFALWAALRVSGSPYVSRRLTPLHVAWLALAVATTASYVQAMANPIGILEMNGADRGLIALTSWSGVFLIIADGTLSRARLERVLRITAGALVLAAAVAMSQYLIGRNWYVDLDFPLLEPSWGGGRLERAGFLRVTGTAVHAIEYGVVQTMGLGLVLHYAFYSHSRRARWAWWAGVVLICATLPLTIARTPVVGVAVVLVMLLPTWPSRRRLRLLMAAPFLLLAIRAAFPGVLGTVYSLFAWLQTDPSTTGRTDDYGDVVQLAGEAPWFGLGVNTLIPDVYLILDNAYLGTLVTLGVVGLLATLAVFVTAIGLGFSARSRFHDPESRDLAHGLTTGVAVAVVGWAIFDGFAFQQSAGLLVVLLGVIAALWRLSGEPECADLELLRSRADETIRWRPTALPTTIALGALMAVLLAGFTVIRTPQAHFEADAALLVRGADGSRGGVFALDSYRVSSLVASVARTPAFREEVRAAGGGTYEVAQGDGSLASVTDQLGYGPIIRIRAIADDPDLTMATLNEVVRVMKRRLADGQRAGPADGAVVVLGDLLIPSAPSPVMAAQSRSILGLVVLSGLSMLAAYLFASHRMKPPSRGGRRSLSKG